uniref:F-box domain-containing protein n=1 Tax=Aegilops tauschii TaxID=37682 RepID=N1QQU8_AEGTA
MDGDRRTPAAAAASAASGLDDDELLREILLRLGFPTCLVRAALVSKRWLHHASDPAFLRRFRDRNPPRLLGFCLCFSGRYRFVPFPQPPELAAPIRRATSSCTAAFARRILPIKHCRNGRLIIEFFNDGRFDYSLAPLLAGEPVAVLPTTPLPHLDWDTTQGRLVQMFLPEDGGRNGITLLYLWAVRRKVYAEVHGSSIPPLSSQGNTHPYSSYGGGYQSGSTTKKIDIPNGSIPLKYNTYIKEHAWSYIETEGTGLYLDYMIGFHKSLSFERFKDVRGVTSTIEDFAERGKQPTLIMLNPYLHYT